MLLATSGGNYLLIKTQQTPLEERNTLAEKTYAPINYEAFSQFRRDGSAYRKSLSWKEWNAQLNVAEDLIFRSRFDRYYLTFWETFFVAQEYRLGFYHSNKDGKYVRFTKESLEVLINNRLDEALREAGALLVRQRF